MVTYIAAVAFYLLALGYNRKLAEQPADTLGWYGCWLALLSFGCSALLMTGGLLGCPVGNLTSNWSYMTQLVGIVGGFMALPGFLQEKK